MPERKNPATLARSADSEWENEGGSVAGAVHDALPEGITAEKTVRYRVGSYTYARLEDAKAQLARQSTPFTASIG
ncbi:hypothetical protein [Aurantiacibacter gangjinensis]|uniref:Uncharacterized protein n=1 Tax=Aurantiacibacter gangjinensis TaxID=502682 RepID=A0A0G9MRD3_9SPHN|nr:hypothetical protein [Aurantiacibacter gangjinensis]APE27926.1 hypothetical protein BMF35_a1097 [Aurantiacibacter gangjinensis]KLE31878.1 hypothetical protein AAW01_10455 [Aurantiacibacter gangjinensis]